MLMARYKLRFGHAYDDPSPHIFLSMVKEFTLDLLHSKETVEYSAYDYAKISKNVHDYYSGAKALSSKVAWWLTFELWRRRIER
jgi:hypothetical protein